MEVTAELAASAVRYLERAISRHESAPGALGRIGLSPAQVRQAVEASRPLTPDEVKRAMVRQVRKGRSGRKGLPKYAVELMYADYRRLNSLSKVAALHGRTRQAMWDIFVGHGLALNPRNFYKPVRHGGRLFTPGKNAYLRATSGDRRHLHKVIWEERNGPIPPGCQVSFADGNKRNFSPDNLICLPIREVALHHHRRHLAMKGALA